MEYFTMSANAMCWHSQLCQLASIDVIGDWEEESVNNDNGREYEEFAFYED